MSKSFYNSQKYKEKQSKIAKKNWEKGLVNFQCKKEKRKCKRKGCKFFFETVPSNPKIYCSKSCAAIVNNRKRGSMPLRQREKISKALKGSKSPIKGKIKIARDKVVCANSKCKKIFLTERWQKRKYCSNKCHMVVMGKKPTSPKAARGKAGIRKDISNEIYFYSRWEANYARLLDYLSIDWEHQPKTFDLKTQNYTPDFYLISSDTYVEIKNFLSEYSRIRDKKFRKLYPDIKLILILKKEYLNLEERYSSFIKNWEYKNSPFI